MMSMLRSGLIVVVWVAWVVAGSAAGAEGEPLPAEAQRVTAALDEDVMAIRAEAQERIAARTREAVAQLQRIQDDYCRAAKLDEAVAVRDRIRALMASSLQAQPDPGNLSGYRNHPRPAELLFKVTGSTEGTCYGTDVYTDDSRLAVAAVHAGVLRSGETGVVRVVLLPGQASYPGSSRQGVSSTTWGSGWSASFRVESPFAPRRAKPLPAAEGAKAAGAGLIPEIITEVDPAGRVVKPESPAPEQDEAAKVDLLPPRTPVRLGSE
jgi:hypothetical protein